MWPQVSMPTAASIIAKEPALLAVLAHHAAQLRGPYVDNVSEVGAAYEYYTMEWLQRQVRACVRAPARARACVLACVSVSERERERVRCCLVRRTMRTRACLCRTLCASLPVQVHEQQQGRNWEAGGEGGRGGGAVRTTCAG